MVLPCPATCSQPLGSQRRLPLLSRQDPLAPGNGQDSQSRAGRALWGLDSPCPGPPAPSLAPAALGPDSTAPHRYLLAMLHLEARRTPETPGGQAGQHHGPRQPILSAGLGSGISFRRPGSQPVSASDSPRGQARAVAAGSPDSTSIKQDGQHMSSWS